MSTMDRDPPFAGYHAAAEASSSYNSNERFYDVSWLVSGMVVKEWESFCPCTLPIMPSLISSTKEQCVDSSAYVMSCPEPTLDRFSSLMPGLHPKHKHMAGSVRSYALRSSYFDPTKEPVCPVPTLWLDVSMPSDGVDSAKRNADIVEWLASTNCNIIRLIIAGPISWLQSSNSEVPLHHMSSFISSILSALKSASQTTISIRHLVFYNCSLSDVVLWPLLGDLLNSSDFPLRSLACVHQLQSGESVYQSLAEILQHPQCKLPELILHGLPSLMSFDFLVRALKNPRSQLRRLSVTACNIGDKEMKEISSLLSSPSCKLTAINLSTNVYTDAGLRHLQEALIKAYKSPSQGDHPLEMLSLCGSHINVRDTEVTKAMAEVLKSPGCALTTLDLTGRRSDPTWLAYLADNLKARKIKLRSLYLLHAVLYVNNYQAPIDELIEALKSSTHILNIQFPWPTEAHTKIADDVMRRNTRLKPAEFTPQEQQLEKPPQEQQLEKPRHVKLFLCGDERVGKTTLREKLLNPSSVYKSSLQKKFGLKKPLTQGMNLSYLQLHEKSANVVICDLAGQREYHAFHTFFMTSTNEDLFLVVCKHEEQNKFEERLQYWLRFIVSHRRQCEPKPMVILVVNYFFRMEEMSSHAKKATEDIRNKFSALLDFGDSSEINVFGVNLASVRDSKCTYPVMTAVERASLKLIGRKPGVPVICSEICSAIDKLRKRLGKTEAPIMTLTELLEKYKERMQKQALSKVAFEQALLELHKIGKVVYFRNDAVEDCSLHEKQLVILDPVWFYEKLVGSLVRTRSPHASSSSAPNAQAHAVWTKKKIHLMLIEEKICKEEYIDTVIKYLENLELFFLTNTSGGEQQLIFPSMAPLQEARFNLWSSRTREGYSFFGRRLDCKEKETSLIPFGVFVRLQVQLHGVYGSNKSFSIGYGWIEFCTEDEIEVFIRFEGVSSGQQHWIDTMVCVPAGSPGLQEPAASIICKVNNSVFDICRGLDRGLCAGVYLQEFVLLEASPSSEVRLLSEVKEEVHSLVLTRRGHSSVGSSKTAELLLPREWKAIFKEMEAAIQELLETFPDLPEVICDEAIHQISALQADLTKSNVILVKLDDISTSMYSKFSEQALLRPRCAGAGAAGNSDALPLGAYLVDEQGKFRSKLMAMVNAKGARLHLMCESFHGCHEVRGQKGAAVTLRSPHRWLAKYAPVLVTALTLASMAGISFFTPALANLFPLLLENELMKKAIKSPIPQQHKVAVPQIVSSYLEGIPDVQQNLLRAQASTGQTFEHLLREFYRYVLEGKDVDMERDFSLHHVYFQDKNRSLWVCGEHISGGIRRPINPFKDLHV